MDFQANFEVSFQLTISQTDQRFWQDVRTETVVLQGEETQNHLPQSLGQCESKSMPSERNYVNRDHILQILSFSFGWKMEEEAESLRLSHC